MPHPSHRSSFSRPILQTFISCGPTPDRLRWPSASARCWTRITIHPRLQVRGQKTDKKHNVIQPSHQVIVIHPIFGQHGCLPARRVSRVQTHLRLRVGLRQSRHIGGSFLPTKVQTSVGNIFYHCARSRHQF